MTYYETYWVKIILSLDIHAKLSDTFAISNKNFLHKFFHQQEKTSIRTNIKDIKPKNSQKRTTLKVSIHWLIAIPYIT